MADRKLTRTETIRVDEKRPRRCGKRCPYLKDVFEERSGPDYQWCKKYSVQVGEINEAAERYSLCLSQFGK